MDQVVSLLAQRGRFAEAIELLAQAPRPKPDDPHYLDIAAKVVRALAASEKPIRETATARRLEEFLRAIESYVLERGVTDEELGAAFEMTGAIMATLRFYEDAMARASGGRIRERYLRER